MKLIKTTLAAMLMSVCVSAIAHEKVHLARVVSVSTIETHEKSLELSAPICTLTSVPTYRQVPVYRNVPVRDASAPAFAALVGAVIANQAFRGSDARAAGTLLGASVGYAAADGYASNRTIVEYQTEVHYETRESCRTEYVPVFRPVITGYRVTFVHNGVQNTVTMRNHPGEYVRIVTSTSYRVDQ